MRTAEHAEPTLVLPRVRLVRYTPGRYLVQLASAVLLLLVLLLQVALLVPFGTATPVRTPGGSLALKEWTDQVADRRLLYPLTVAYTHLEWWRPAAEAAARRGTTFTVRRNTGWLGTYRLNEIVIDERVLAEPIDVQVAILVHEVAHATSPRPHLAAFFLLRLTSFGARLCFEEERDAMYWQALAYKHIIREPGTETAQTRAHDELVTLLEQDRLGERVLRSATYQDLCLGGVIR